MADLHIDTTGVRILLVDPDDGRRGALAATLAQLGYAAIIEVAGAAGGGRLTDAGAADLVIMNVDAGPLTSSALGAIRAASGRGTDLPVLGVTSDGTAGGRARAAAVGVQDVAVHPLDPVELRLRVDNALTGARLRRLLDDRSERLTKALREHTDDFETVRESLAALAAMADYHDDDSDRHAQRVGSVAAAVAEALGLSESAVRMLRAAAPLHDIGKVGVSRRILLKPEKLTPPEWMHMMQHVDIGGQILGSAHSAVLRLAGEIARTHHERWDGSGYTAGLAGEEIPISGRIVAVADVWDTLTHDRPYRRAWEPEAALAEIREQAGKHFDPRVVEAFCTLDHDALARLDDERPLAA
ncbi:MAG TPA: HD domain-containing phosphohydrolase [Solirubrobacteraceae bacterium]|nr:HD domain-containing phosphohydrolase [Solirubrobacteraceae bacterium]